MLETVLHHDENEGTQLFCNTFAHIEARMRGGVCTVSRAIEFYTYSASQYVTRVRTSYSRAWLNGRVLLCTVF